MPLVLSRKVGEKIVIDHDIIVTIKEIRGKKCQLLFDAPDDVDIIREELLRKDAKRRIK
jgi:carbon storage regulator